MSVTVTTDEEVNPDIHAVCVGVSMRVASILSAFASPATNGVHPVTVRVRVAPAPVNVAVIPVICTRLFIRNFISFDPVVDEEAAYISKFQVPAGMEARPSGQDTNLSRNTGDVPAVHATVLIVSENVDGLTESVRLSASEVVASK